jgi:hypothetical protein
VDKTHALLDVLAIVHERGAVDAYRVLDVDALHDERQCKLARPADAPQRQAPCSRH